MSDTKAPWFRTPAGTRPKHDAPRGPQPNWWGPADMDKKRQGREKRRERQPQRKPGGAPSYKPYDYPRRPTPERTPRPVSPPAKPGAVRVPKLRIPRVFGNPLLDIGANVVENFINPSPNVVPRLPSNYEWCNGPHPISVVTWNPLRVVKPSSGPFFTGIGSCDVPPIDGQSSGPAPPRSEWYKLTGQRHYWWLAYEFVWGGGERAGAALGTVHRVGPVLNPQPQAVPVHVTQNWSNPNHERWLPTLPDPFPAPKPALEVGHGTPVGEPDPVTNPDAAYEPDYQWGYQIGVGPGPAFPIGPGNPAPAPVAPSPSPILPVVREPPPSGEKQRKVITKSAAVGVALYKALHRTSEGFEIIDAVYDALPDDVKKRWYRPERQGDQYGPYGLHGADWKLRALYHNWHRLDPVEAIKNIFRNEFEDRLYGRIHRALPVNEGQAHSHGYKTIDELLDEFFAGKDWVLDYLETLNER